MILLRRLILTMLGVHHLSGSTGKAERKCITLPQYRDCDLRLHLAYRLAGTDRLCQRRDTATQQRDCRSQGERGAEASSILRMLSISILKVALGAVVIGIVSSWYVSGIWMQQFPDSSVLSPFWFIIVGICLLALIVLVVVVRAWRIANENPVKSIKSE